MEKRSFFITGTDTSVGKTVTSAFLCYHLRYDYFKPIQTGDIKDSDFVKEFSNQKTFKETYHFKTPASPHIAAKIESSIIEMSSITLPKQHSLIVEGAGGVLVPLNKNEFIIDLIKYLDMPVVVVARTAIGTINHTLLTIEALEKRNTKIAGIVLVGEKEDHTFKTIGDFVKILLHIPYVRDLNDLKSKKYFEGCDYEQFLQNLHR